MNPYKVFAFYDATIAFPTAFFLYIFVELGVNPTLLSYMFLVNIILIILLEYPTGIIADRYGRKTSMIVSNICFAMSYLAALYSYFNVFLVLHFILTSIAITCRSGSQTSWLQEFTQKSANHHADFQKFEKYGLYGRLLGCVVGMCVYFATYSYYGSVMVLLLFYAISSYLFAKLPEAHCHKKDKHLLHSITETIAYTKAHYAKAIMLTLILGSVFILSLPIYMYYPILVEQYFKGDLKASILAVGSLFVCMCLVGIYLTKLTQRYIEKNPNSAHAVTIFISVLLALISPVIWLSVYLNVEGVLLILPVICSGLFTVIRTLVNSIITDMLKKDNVESEMSTLMSMFSALGSIVFSIIYFIIILFTKGNEYEIFIQHYAWILPCALITVAAIFKLKALK